MEIFIEDQQFNTREYRKETARNFYVTFRSAHPKHCFKGIVKSQMYRLRCLFSRDSDFTSAVSLALTLGMILLVIIVICVLKVCVATPKK